LRGDRHRPLVTPEKVLSEYNEDLIFLLKMCVANIAIILAPYCPLVILEKYW